MSLRDYVNGTNDGFSFQNVDANKVVINLATLQTVSQAALPADANLPALAAETVGCIAVCGAAATGLFTPGELVRVVA
jgi:uncharacterized protein YuzB (UPF0349 family)